MKRRDFLSLLAAQCFLSGSVFAQTNRHPFESLIDIETGQYFKPNSEKFSLVIFMTAQQSYPSCGGAFLGVRQVIMDMGVNNNIEPILIMPRIGDQQDPHDHRNLAQAKSYDVNFRILTGSLLDIKNASAGVGAFFKINAADKVYGHTLDAYFLTPSGKKLFQHPAEDYFTFSPLVEKIIGKCHTPENIKLCL